MKEKYHIVILLLLLVLSAGLRLYQLGDVSLWFDETLTASKTLIPFNRIIDTMAETGEENPPGYFFLINIWSRLFGKSGFSLRFPSLIFSLLGVFTIYYLGKNLFSPKVGLMAALLLSISPYNINYAQEARMYSLVWSLGLGSFYFFYRWIRDGSTRALVFAILVNLLAFCISYSQVLIIITQNIIFLIIFNRKLVKRWLVSQIILLALISPLIFLLLEQSANRSVGGWIYLSDNFRVLFRGTLSYMSGDLSGRGSLAVWGTYLILIAIGGFSFADHRLRLKPTREDYFLWLWGIIPITIGLGINLFFYPFLSPLTIRYIGFIQFPFFLAASRGISRLRPGIGLAMLLLLAGVTVSKYLIPYYRDDIRIGKEDWRGLIAHLEETADDTSLLVLTPGTFLPYRYYGTGKISSIQFQAKDGEPAIGPGHEKVTVIYRNWKQRNRLKVLVGYSSVEHFSSGNIGFYRFESSPVIE